MDTVFFALILSALLIPLVPWENLRSLKAAGIELSLDRPEVESAISGLGLERIKSEQLKKGLVKLGEELQAIQGSRVLWIDDNPHRITGERRLLRALGIQVIPAATSAEAERILESDNDFDLIITDVQRIGNSHEIVGGIDIHEGTNFVVKLRSHKDPVIQSMPVIFYAAYPWQKLTRFTRPARELLPEPEISNSVTDFVPKVVKRLAKARATPIATNELKVPTDERWHEDVT